MTVRLWGVYSELTDRRKVAVSVPRDATPRDVVRALARSVGPVGARRLYSEGGTDIADTIVLAVNDVVITRDSLDAPLSTFGPKTPVFSVSVIFHTEGG